MRRHLLIPLLLLLSFSLPAHESREVRVLAGLGNDLWDFGLNRNGDDQLSFAFRSSILYHDWDIYFALDGITNRGWKSDGIWYSGRYDRMTVSAAYSVGFHAAQNLTVRLKPGFGLKALGDLHLEDVQNFVHSLSDIKPLVLPYDSIALVSPLLIAKADVIYDAARISDESVFRLTFSAGADIAPAAEAEYYALAGFSIAGKDYEIISISFGLSGMIPFTTSYTQQLLGYMTSGLSYSFTIDGGLIQYRGWGFPFRHFGFNTISIDLMSFFKRSDFKRSDLFISSGYSFMKMSPHMETELGVYLRDNWYLVLRNRYLSGWADEGIVLSEGWKESWRIKDMQTLFSLGGGYEWNVPKAEFLYLYSDASIGIGIWNNGVMANMDPVAASPYYGFEKQFRFLVDAEAGILLLPEALTARGRSSFRIKLGAGLSYVFGADSIDTDKRAEGLEAVNSSIYAAWIPRLSLMIRTGIDL